VGPFVRARTVLVVPSVVIVCLSAIVSRTFVGVMSEFATFTTLALADVAALVCVMTLLAAVFALAFLPLESL
jgi:hypothetical protein